MCASAAAFLEVKGLHTLGRTAKSSLISFLCDLCYTLIDSATITFNDYMRGCFHSDQYCKVHLEPGPGEYVINMEADELPSGKNSE